MLKSVADITERGLNDDVLKMSEERFRLVANSATDAIISGDSEGRIIFWNRAAEMIFGYSAEEAVGKSITLIIPERFREKHKNGMNRVVTTGKTKIIGKTVELTAIRRGGDEFPVELSLSRWRTAEGVFFTGIIRDITERRRIEEELRRANNRMRSDLEVARKVQKSLLPKESSEILGVNFASAYHPCDELGGDIFNYFKIDDRHIGLYMLDVSGHGVPAALLSITLSRFLHPHAEHLSIIKQRINCSSEYRIISPDEVAMHLNRQFPMNLDTLQFFTLVYGILNLETNELRFVCAGQNGPVHIPYDSEPVNHEHPGFPIGFLKEVKYEVTSISLKPGDRLYLFSDGIIEATNSDEKQFGTKRIIGLLNSKRNVRLEESISALLNEVNEWCGDNRPEDDISVLAIEMNGTHYGSRFIFRKRA